MTPPTPCPKCGTMLTIRMPTALEVPREVDGTRHHVIRCLAIVITQRDEARAKVEGAIELARHIREEHHGCDPNTGVCELCYLAIAILNGKRLTILLDCGQDVVCATPPGCGRHWAERNRELVQELSELRKTLPGDDDPFANPDLVKCGTFGPEQPPPGRFMRGGVWYAREGDWQQSIVDLEVLVARVECYLDENNDVLIRARAALEKLRGK